MVFPVVVYGCESWTVKKADRRRIDAFEVWCWRRLLRVPWTARRSYQSILKEISPGCPLEGMMLKLKLQYFGHLLDELTHWKRLWCWAGLGQEEKGTAEDEMPGWHLLRDGRESEWTLRGGIRQGGLVCCNSRGCKESDTTARLNWLTDWLGFPIMKLFLCIAVTNSGDNTRYCIYKCCPHPILSLTLSGTQFAYIVDVFISPAPDLESISHFHCIIIRDLI